MAKRFTDTEKWFDSWFRELPTDYKLFWIYLCDRCNNAGVWKIDIDLANFVIGSKVDLKKAAAHYGDRMTPLREGYLLVRGFVPFQFGELSPNNRMHASVLNLISKEGASKGLKWPISRGQGKGKGQGKGREGVGGFRFDDIWSRYPRRLGRKEAERHFISSVKSPQDWADIQNALDNYILQIRKEHTSPEYIKNGSTWFNNWRDYVNYAGVSIPLEVKPSIPVVLSISSIERLADPAAREAAMRLREEKLKEIAK